MTDDPVLLSTSSVFPEPTSAAFEMAADLGYDGVEVMVWTDAVSQDAAALRGLSEHYGVKVGSVHAPCLLVTQRVWSPDPWERLRRRPGWPRRWARRSSWCTRRSPGRRVTRAASREGIAELRTAFGSVRVRGGEHVPGDGWPAASSSRTRRVTTRPTSASTRTPWICRTARRRSATCSRWPTRWAPGLRTSTSATAPARRATSTWCPAAARQPCGELLASLARRGFTGSVAVEVSTRRAASRAERKADLAEALAFARDPPRPRTVHRWTKA